MDDSFCDAMMMMPFLKFDFTTPEKGCYAADVLKAMSDKEAKLLFLTMLTPKAMQAVCNDKVIGATYKKLLLEKTTPSPDNLVHGAGGVGKSYILENVPVITDVPEMTDLGTCDYCGKKTYKMGPRPSLFAARELQGCRWERNSRFNGATLHSACVHFWLNNGRTARPPTPPSEE